MAKISCIIVDDEPVAQRILERYVMDLPELQLEAICQNALEARVVLQNNTIDLIFLDLEMPKLKGFAFLKTLSPIPATIITTAYREYALESYELQVVDYLLKPFTFERFIKAVDRYQQLYQTSDETSIITPKELDFLDVKSDRKTVRLQKGSILYIEGMNNYVKIHTSDKTWIVYASLQKMSTQLGVDFLRIHKSYIVNKNKLTAFSHEQVELNNIILPIGLTYKENIRQL